MSSLFQISLIFPSGASLALSSFVFACDILHAEALIAQLGKKIVWILDEDAISYAADNPERELRLRDVQLLRQ